MVYALEATKEVKAFYKPVLIEIPVEELINHIRIKADSSVDPSCNLSYADEKAYYSS